MNLKKIGKRGNILTENLIFLILNLVFLVILILFVFVKMDSAFLLEESYAKQIALLIDGARHGTSIRLNMEDAIKIAENEGWDIKKIVSKTDNVIIVKLREKGGYSYSFFSDVDVDAYLNKDNKKEYIINVN